MSDPRPKRLAAPLRLLFAAVIGVSVGCVTDFVADDAADTLCTGEQIDCDGTCIEPETNDNCGDCGVACAPEEHCHDRVCACDAGLHRCDGTCVDFATDPQHCGECDHPCGAAQECVANLCVSM